MTSNEGGNAAPDAPSAAGATVPPEPRHGRVILQISNSVLPLEKLTPTPSYQDGMTAEIETDLRNIGCDLIQTAGKLLRLPQVFLI